MTEESATPQQPPASDSAAPPSAGTKRPAFEITEPNPTLYVSNIDWSVKKPVLRRSLHALFNRHGKILDIITLRREGLRGQAWVIFDDVVSASAALKAENGFTFFGRELKIAFAREKSDRIARRDGERPSRSSSRRAKRAKPEKAASVSVENPSDLAEASAEGARQLPPPPPPTPAAPAPAAAPAAPSPAAVPPPPPPPPPAAELPSKILFAQDLPSECNEMMLAMLFRQHVGYKEVRIPRPGLAFVEFEDEPHATLALKALNGFKLTLKDTLNLKYGKA